MPRRAAKRMPIELFIQPIDNAFADRVIGNLVVALNTVNEREYVKMKESALFEEMHAFLEQRNVEMICQGSGPVNMMTSASDYDYVLIFQKDEEAVNILKELAAHMHAVVKSHETKPGNLVTMEIKGKSCDMLCVSEMVVSERIVSLNTYDTATCDACTYSHIPIHIRESEIVIQFVPDNLTYLQRMSYFIKNSQPSYAAYLLLKTLFPKLSSACIVCLITMSNKHAPSMFAVLHHVFINMKAIAELQQCRRFHSHNTHIALQRMSQVHTEDGCMFVLTPFQLVQIANVLPVFTIFLKKMSLIDEDETICIIGDANPINNKFRTMCIDLTDLLLSTDPTIDFKAQSHGIVSRF